MLSRYVFQSDFAKRYFSAGVQEGRQEGRQEGQLEGRQEVLTRQLLRRYGPSALALTRALGSLDLGDLDWLADEIMLVDDLGVLEQRLNARRMALS